MGAARRADRRRAGPGARDRRHPLEGGGRLLRARGDRQGRVFHYPREGFGQIAATLADAAQASGAELLTGHAVTGVRPDGDTVLVDSADRQHRARQVFSTLPLPVLAGLTSPPAPPAAVADAAGLRFRAMVLVYVVHAGGRWTPYDAHYLPGPETPVTRISALRPTAEPSASGRCRARRMIPRAIAGGVMEGLEIQPARRPRT